MKLLIMTTILLTSSCNHVYQLPDIDQHALTKTDGKLVYTGTVSNRRTNEVIFVYDRTVSIESNLSTSAHTTLRPQSR